MEITSLEQLRSLYRQPSEYVQNKKSTVIGERTAEFLQSCSFLVLATSDADGNCDASPRGGPPGFVRVLDEKRLAFPDLSGNNLIDSLCNIVANPSVGILAMVPGTGEGLRANGRAHVTTAPEILELWSATFRTPKCAVVIDIDDVFIHCAKAFQRGNVWNPNAWIATERDPLEMFGEHLGVTLDPDKQRPQINADYRLDLDSELAD